LLGVNSKLLDTLGYLEEDVKDQVIFKFIRNAIIFDRFFEKLFGGLGILFFAK